MSWSNHPCQPPLRVVNKNYLTVSLCWRNRLTSLSMVRRLDTVDRKNNILLTSYCVTEFDVVVSPKRKANKWTVNIEQAGLEDLKDYIRELYRPPALENDGAVLNFMNDEGRYSPRNDASFREMLRSLVTKKSLKFTVFIETPSKPFSEWTFPKVCELYGLSDDPNPDIDVFPVFLCGSADLDNDKSKAVVKHLMAELNLRKKTTPLTLA